MYTSLLRRSYNTAVTWFSHVPQGPQRMEALVCWLHRRGFQSLPFPAVFRNAAVYLPLASQNFTTPRVIRRASEGQPGLERWWVESPAMRRVVEIQILTLGDCTTPQSLLMLLDGSSASSTNGWIHEGHIADTLQGEQVVVVMPTQASGSHYADWISTDPTLGYMQWETFLSSELPPLLADPQYGLNLNGQCIIGGLSMGASAAVRIANHHPEVFDGVIGISGCYSTTDPMGWEYHHAITRSVGGHTRNLWNAHTRQQADTALHPDGLKHTAVYLFTANGRITQRDIEFHLGRPFLDLLGSVLLEFASWCCTQRLDAAMRTAGMQHYQVVYQTSGIHDWIYCSEQLRAGWEWIQTTISHMPKHLS